MTCLYTTNKALDGQREGYNGHKGRRFQEGCWPKTVGRDHVWVLNIRPDKHISRLLAWNHSIYDRHGARGEGKEKAKQKEKAKEKEKERRSRKRRRRRIE
eukprot:16450558-Heterocapsa_arctica.AAC.1